MTPDTPVSAAFPDDELPLSLVPVGRRRMVRAVGAAGRAELEREGMLPGSLVIVAARTPLGGPLIVQLGRTRLAISAVLAAQVSTGPWLPVDEPGR